jgi:hypothetical protein
MKKLTAKQILEVIESKLSVDEFGYGDFDFDELGLGKITTVDHYGGEGKGEEYWTVYHFKDHDVYIRIDGFYSSYCGVEFYDGYGYEVRPIEKTIIIYNKI